MGVFPNPVFVRQKLGVVRSEGSKVARETVISNRSPHLAPPLDGVVSSPTPTFHLGNHYTSGATTLYLGMGNHCTWTPGAIGNHYHTCLLWATTESWAHCTLGNHPAPDARICENRVCSTYNGLQVLTARMPQNTPFDPVLFFQECNI